METANGADYGEYAGSDTGYGVGAKMWGILELEELEAVLVIVGIGAIGGVLGYYLAKLVNNNDKWRPL